MCSEHRVHHSRFNDNEHNLEGTCDHVRGEINSSLRPPITFASQLRS